MKRNSGNHLRILFTCFAVLFAFAAGSNTALAGTCSVDCLSVYSNVLSDAGTSIKGTVKLIDETGSAGGARGAVVHAAWTRPDGSVFDQYGVIGSRLRAEFSLYTAGAPGTYTLTIVDVTKTGYKFEPKNQSQLSQDITVGTVGNEPPIAVANAEVVSGSVPLTVSFDSSGSKDPDGAIMTYDWDFGDGGSSSETNPIHTYQDTGIFNAVLTVTDDMGEAAISSVSVTVAESDEGCIGYCLSVDQIAMSYKKKTGQINGNVWVVDENGSRVADAVVHAVWILPDGVTEIDEVAVTGRRSIATFFLNADQAGLYTLKIVGVVNNGSTFDPQNSNVLTGMIETTQ